MTEERISYLLRKYYAKTASNTEREELMALLKEGAYDGDIRRLILTLIREEKTTDIVLETEKTEAILNRIFIDNWEKTPRPFNRNTQETDEVFQTASGKSIGSMLRRYGVAASLLVGIAIGIANLLGSGQSDGLGFFPINDSEQQETALDLTPGSNRALLTLWDGTVISLDTVEKQQSFETSDYIIDPSKGELVYRGVGRKNGYNLVTTPLGGQYKVVLPDGSIAWLNAGSSLKFPTTFESGSRKVEVTGEVFFDVKQHRRTPFVVVLPDHVQAGERMEIVVLGTQFNVSSYKEDPSIQTTLVKGSVKVMKGKESKVLVPGEQAEVKAAGEGNARIEVKSVDAESVVAWKEGWFEFGGKNMEEIMRQIARWYAVDVEFENEELRRKEFLGAVSRKESAGEVLKVLEMTGGIRFEIDGQRIKVKAI